jgi:nucleotidyltransferase substrate binding protein (TIGR01987 family)
VGADRQKLTKQLEQFDRAALQLERALKLPKNDIVRDSAIKRFEITFELFWKLLKEFAVFHGFEANSPRRAIQEAFHIGIIPEEEAFVDMLDVRNLCSHTYSEDLAENIYPRLPGFANAMRKVYEKVFEELKTKP